MLIDYFLSVDCYPRDGCALLVRDGFHLLYGIDNLPAHSDIAVTVSLATDLVNLYKSAFLQQINEPEHGCMTVGKRGTSWHCGIFTTEQVPHYIIHTLCRKIKIDTLSQFKRRFDIVEFYKYAPHHPI